MIFGGYSFGEAPFGAGDDLAGIAGEPTTYELLLVDPEADRVYLVEIDAYQVPGA